MILGGSIAHGFARPDSDIDLLIVVSDREDEARLKDGRLQFFDNQVCTYDGYAEASELSWLNGGAAIDDL